MTLSSGSSYPQMSVRIMNMVGQVQSQRFSNVNGIARIDVSALPKGIYFVAVAADGKALPAITLIVD